MTTASPRAAAIAALYVHAAALAAAADLAAAMAVHETITKLLGIAAAADDGSAVTDLADWRNR